jgi:two-component system, chemotaxis family, CheB/CheR fusion protein
MKKSPRAPRATRDRGAPPATPSSITAVTPPSRDTFPIVGIGASAGGLEAFSELLSHLPAEAAMAFVLVQHLDPKHPSSLVEILSRTTRLPVVEATHRMRVEPGHVYIMPPNVRMTMADGVLNLAPRSSDRGPHMPIDHFLCSLAESLGGRAIGVILSGSASDGALGLKAIKAEGGVTFAEAPQSAKFDGMPRSAVASGAVDFVLPPKAIAQELARIGRHPYLGQAGAAPPPEALASGPEALDQILRMLREKSGIDFTLYRQTTIRRRIARRMMIHGLDTLENYRRYLEAHPSQVHALYNDLLVNVTRFFRDPEAFRILQQSVLPSIIKQRPDDAPIRVWAPGCATGEEAYSLAIVLLESLGDAAGTVPIQLFGTDASEIAIVKARAGTYPEHIELDVTASRLRRFFVKLDSQHQVRKAVRELCVFARHNLATDPPFSKMDLIVCRNVLIYLEPDLQRRVLSVFHYALKDPGFLMLGVAETVGPLADFFSIVDKKYRVYAKRPTSRRFDLGSTSFDQRLERAGIGRAARSTGEASGGPSDLLQEVDRILLTRYAPAGVLVNEASEILQFRGHTSPYLEPAPGQASLNLLKMAREGLLMELRVAIDKARKQNAPVRRERLNIKQDGGLAQVTLEVIPVRGPGRERNYLVLFESVPPSEEPSAPGSTAPSATLHSRRAATERQIENLRQELTATKEFLQSIIQEREAANEELQAANEELQSSNEELQSTNEELETAKEELQSVNEELTTVNEELQQRNADLFQLNNDLNNLFAGVNIPIIMVGGDGRIRRFTPTAGKMLSLITADLGRPIGDIRLNLDLSDLEQVCKHVIDTATIVEREVRDRDGRWYSLRVRPYTTADNKIDGTVITLTDINALKSSVDQATAAREHAEAIVDSVAVPLVVLDAALRVAWASRSFYETFKVRPEETTERFIYELGAGQWNIPALRKALAEVFEKNIGFLEFEVEHDWGRIGAKTMLLNARPVHSESKARRLILLAIDDITTRRQAERALRAPG